MLNGIKQFLMLKGSVQDYPGQKNAAGGTPESVNVVITDVDKSDWGSGGELCSDKFPD